MHSVLQIFNKDPKNLLHYRFVTYSSIKQKLDILVPILSTSIYIVFSNILFFCSCSHSQLTLWNQKVSLHLLVGCQLGPKD